jgi:hypothetical protein
VAIGLIIGVDSISCQKNAKNVGFCLVKKVKRTALGVLLLPFCYGVGAALWFTLPNFRSVPEGSFYFIAGILSYLAFQWVFFRPIRTYVFGHELTHAMAAWMTGGKVRHFHVSKKGGSVTVTKTNFFVALAPYMVPLYALGLVGAFYGISHFYPLRSYWNSFIWLLGAAVGFHMALTVYALKHDQPDLKLVGKFLSAVIIFLGNTASIIFLLGLLFPRTISWNRFLRLSGAHTVIAWREVGHGGYALYAGASHALADRN